jgi:aminoglycoside phosphotransferase (APT) family kinase protein
MEKDQVQEYKLKLISDFPDLNIESVKVIGTGWHHVAIEVNEGIIFRLPRGIHVKDLSSTIHYETEILRQLKDELPVDIPDPKYISPDKTYFGYPRLMGEILENIISNFTDSDWQQLLEDWVDIASTIHTEISVEEARSLGVPDFDGFDTTMAEKVFHLNGIDQEIVSFAQSMIQGVKSLDKDAQNWIFIHNDLQFHNLLADPISKRISGIIDWTDVCIAPIAREFAIGELMQSNLLPQAVDLYKKKTGIQIDEAQVIMWRAVEGFSDYVEEIEGGESKEAAETLKRIEQLMELSASEL